MISLRMNYNDETNFLFDLFQKFCQDELKPVGLLQNLEVAEISDLLMKHWSLEVRARMAEFRINANSLLHSRFAGACTGAITWMCDNVNDYSRKIAAEQFKIVRDLACFMQADGAYSILSSPPELPADLADIISDNFNVVHLQHSNGLIVPIPEEPYDGEWTSPEAISRNAGLTDIYIEQIEFHVETLMAYKGIDCDGQFDLVDENDVGLIPKRG